MASSDSLSLPRLGLALLDRLAEIKAGGRLMLVSSAGAREGKSFVARALARQLETLTATRVLLVETGPDDIALDAGAAGFSALLKNGEMPEAAIKATDRSGLFLLKAGAQAVGSEQLLFQPGHVRRALQLLRDQFDLVVIDGPRLAHCGSLALQADATVLVLDAQLGSGKRIEAALTASRLPAAQIAGVIINRQPGYLARWFGG